MPQITCAKVLQVCCLCLLLRGIAWCRPALRDKPGSDTATAALLSDSHLDPFRDPAKAKRLAAARVSEWAAILAQPASPTAAADFAALQKTCGERLPDADTPLVLSAFDAAAAAKPAFVLVAGDLLVHAFACRYRTLLDRGGTDESGLADFAAKTIEFQIAQMKRRFPRTPVHLALGNNDSDCEDYSLDQEGRFLARLAPALAAGWSGISADDRRGALQDFKRFGSYAVDLPIPHLRLIALDDLYLSSDYRGTCRRKPNAATATALLAWLETQLTQARKNHGGVWVLAHIPPGVNIYRTYQRSLDICHGTPPATFFPDNALADLLASYSDTVRVFISGHTHVDEIHRIGEASGDRQVPLKTVPSLSPISGNAPAFLVATVDSSSGTLRDYSLRTASANSNGNMQWKSAYRFQAAYQESSFTAASLNAMMHRWQTDPAASAAQIQNYQDHLASGLRLLAVRLSWPQQLCAMQHSSATGFTRCACEAAGGLLPGPQAVK